MFRVWQVAGGAHSLPEVNIRVLRNNPGTLLRRNVGRGELACKLCVDEISRATLSPACSFCHFAAVVRSWNIRVFSSRATVQRKTRVDPAGADCAPALRITRRSVRGNCAPGHLSKWASEWATE